MEVDEKQILAKPNDNYISFLLQFLTHQSPILQVETKFSIISAFVERCKEIQLLVMRFFVVVLVIFVILVMLVHCLTLKYRFMRMLINWYRTQANLQCKVCFI